jgi:hypothetical protein
MASHNDNGLHITPLTMAVCGVLWAVLFALMAWNLTTTVSMAKAMNNLPEQVRDHEDRLRALERKP